MGKYLSGSAQTGTKIMKNLDLFTYAQTEPDPDNGSGVVTYHFNWRFDGQQFGHIGIGVKNQKISSSSQINTDNQSPHKFGRPLGLYNDRSLEQVFSMMMQSVGITITGVYSD